MTITLTHEQEQRITDLVASGLAATPQEVIDHALRALPAGDRETVERNRQSKSRFLEVCSKVQGLTEGLDFSSNQSAARPVDL